MEEFNWYVVKTTARSEKRVHERLRKDGYETYLPLLKTVKIWSDRKKKVTQPLIPSTLFIKTSRDNLHDVYPYQGVSSILNYLSKPAVVKEHEINNLRILLQQEAEGELETIEQLQEGETVQVTRGPFQGLIATAIQTEQKFRVVVELHSMGTGFVVNVPKSYLRKVKSK